MRQYARELDHRFQQFSAAWPAARDRVQTALATHTPIFKESYRRIASLQAWRSYVIEPCVSKSCVSFFLEAQNDALVSHTLAQMGAWRVALKALRSCIENVTNCLYYKDHPIELEWWLRGDHRLSFSELLAYLQKHPSILGLPGQVHGLDQLQIEYRTLSRAVHASAKIFRMTDDSQVTVLWKNERAALGAWQTREKRTFILINQLLLCVFRDQLQGAALPEVRKAAAFTIPAATRPLVQQHLHIRLPAPPANT